MPEMRHCACSMFSNTERRHFRLRTLKDLCIMAKLRLCSFCPNLAKLKEPSKVDEKSLPALEEMLPQSHKHVVCSLKRHGGGFEAVLNVDITTKEQALKWLADHEAVTKVTWRSDVVEKKQEVKVLYKERFRCQHKVMHRSDTASARRGSKDTGCEAQLIITVNKNTFTSSSGHAVKSRSKDPHRREYPTEIVLRHRHNHPIFAASALKHRDVSEQTKETVDRLLLEGYAPSAALEKLKFDLQTDDPENYITISGDRAFCPDNGWMYKRREKLGTEKYGKTNTEDLKAYVESVNEQFVKGAAHSPQSSAKDGDPQTSAEVGNPQRSSQGDDLDGNTDHDYVRMSVNDGHTVVVVCTPLMRRVHKSVVHSGEMVFMDATGNLEKGNFRVFLLMTHSCVGGLPLGVMITSGETASIIKTGLRMLVDMVGEDGFHGRGARGPKYFMTDDCRAERTALGEVFPEATTYLCAFHLLQAFWRFVWDQKHGVERRLRPHLFGLVKSILYARDLVHAEEMATQLREDGVMREHPHILAYVEKQLMGRMNQWVICFREGELVRGNHTNNFCEAAMRILKDQILKRTKAFNVQQLLDFVTTNFEEYYARRCIDVGNNQLSRVLRSRFLMDVNGIDAATITQVGELLFDVQSEKDPDCLYRVDMSVGLCTCKVGNTGGPCKHQAGIVKKFNLPSWNFIPESNAEMRQKVCFIGSGKVQPIEWFQSLRGGCCGEGIFEGAEGANEAGGADGGNEAGGADGGDEAGGDGGPEAEVGKGHKELTLRLQALMESWMKKVEADPELYADGLEAFLKNAKGITTAAKLNSSWQTFGKYSGFSHSRTQQLASSKRIGLQPTAIQRRRGVLPGCKRSGLGRPTLKQKLSEAVMPKSKRQKAPHNLAACVAVNSSLGKTHSQK